MGGLALQGLTPERMVRALPGTDLREARKVVSAVHRELWPAKSLAGVRRAVIQAVSTHGAEPRLRTLDERASKVDPFVKYLLGAPDGERIETVRIPLERRGRYSVCVSSQVGCALACSFCATGRLGLRRNLQTWEIVEQVRVVRRGLQGAGLGRVHGVVFQGMGEPLANLDRVLEAIEVFRDPSALAIDARAVTVCTSGIPVGIRRLAREAPNVRLGVSLGSLDVSVRRNLMPISVTHPLTEVLAAASEHARVTKLAPMFALTLLAGVNDSDDDARLLAETILSFAKQAGTRPRLSLIPYNPIDRADREPYSRTSTARDEAFRDTLRSLGVVAHVRYSGGGDVAAACGQLAGSQA